MRGRPNLFTTYESEIALVPTWTKRVALVSFAGFLLLAPVGAIPGLRFLGGADWLRLLSQVLVFAIAALGLNILVGYTGQVSLGHSFFLGLGAYTAAVLGGPEGESLWGLGLPLWIWLPASGLVAALVGMLVTPGAVRTRGLYLAFVTLGLLFVGEHFFRNLSFITGGGGLGRRGPPFELRLWKEETPLVSFTADGEWFGIFLTGAQKFFYFALVLAILAVLASKNLARTRIGRALMSIRDRDVAAEIVGVSVGRYKLIAFGISSFFAGVAGALMFGLFSILTPEEFGLLLAIEFLAMVLIGGAGTIIGVLIGTAFITTLPRLVRDFTSWLQFQATSDGAFAWLGNLVISTGPGDFGIVSEAVNGPGLNIFQLNAVLYGLLLIGFLMFEPLGLFGIWIRIRNYWKSWPFTY